MKPFVLISLASALLSSYIYAGESQTANIIRTAAPVIYHPKQEPVSPSLSLNSQALPDATSGTPYSYEFTQLVSWSGFPLNSPLPALSWSSINDLPSGMTLDTQGQLAGIPNTAETRDFEILATYANGMSRQLYTLKVNEALSADPESCKDIKAKNPAQPSGIYQVKINESDLNVYCDMVTDGGGWTMVVAQFETDPVKNWNEGIQSDYDPSLQTSKSFALNTSQIPNHSQTSFGRSLNPTFSGYANFTYTTGNIPVTDVIGIGDGFNYKIHRSIISYYGAHNPAGIFNSVNVDWFNSLTFDRENVGYNWSFSPMHQFRTHRGYGLKGAVYPTSETTAWTVWVR